MQALQESSDDDWLEEPQPIKALFSDEVFQTAQEVFEDAKTNGFDFGRFRLERSLDFYGCMKLLNYLRDAASRMEPTAVVKSLSETHSPFNDDKYLRPTLQDDALLFTFDNYPKSAPDAEKTSEPKAGGMPIFQATPSNLQEENAELRSRVQALEARVQEMSAKFQTIMDGKPSARPQRAPARACDYYFDGYSHHDIHQEMITDKIRTSAYRDFIEGAHGKFKGKVVLDVGCGSGILSMFAGRAGAKQVFGVDAANIVDRARAAVAANGLSEVVVLLQGRIEKVKLPVDKVDIIISEWMGYFLVFEGMFSSVIDARDKLLVDGGRVYPNRAEMFIAGLSYDRSRRNMWQDMYKLDLRAIYEKPSTVSKAAIIEDIAAEAIVTDCQLIKEFDMEKCSDADFDWQSSCVLTMQSDANVLDALVVYFDCWFDEDVVLSTAPGKETHWKQTILLLPSPLTLAANRTVTVELAANRTVENTRNYNIFVQIKDPSGDLLAQKLYILD